MFRKPIHRLEEFKDKAKAAEDACKKNPNDTESKKKWAKALINSALCARPCSSDDIGLLYEAITKLEEVLEIHREDNKTRFLLGRVYYDILFLNPSWPREEEADYDAILKICDKAIDCFKIVKDEAPDVYQVSDMLEEIQRQAELYKAHKLRKDHLPAKSAPPDMQYENDLEMDLKDAKRALFFEIWSKYGTALSELSITGNKEREMIADSIAELENRVLRNPNDKKAKKELMNAYDQLVAEPDFSEVERSVKRSAAMIGDVSFMNENEYKKDMEIDPNNARRALIFEIWSKYGPALRKLSICGNKKREMIADSIAELENELMINPNNKKAKEELLNAYDQLVAEVEPNFSGVERSAAVIGEASFMNENEVECQKNKKLRREA